MPANAQIHIRDKDKEIYNLNEKIWQIWASMTFSKLLLQVRMSRAPMKQPYVRQNYNVPY